ncbi:hypothetical protein C8F04DRAFT_1273103 [Mycena alexandri]|uniref:Uncharacterized protein n=1 Tax=Mycena alexandri TaxID=1745969 RepID=A0AAD6S8Z0_9AGAR|nr:hypothetical protein C8F04DRAFT_1273103 [Mycena alexandri]
MPAPTWTTTAQFELLQAHMPDYIVRQAQKKVNKFWPIVWEAFFREHPVDGMLGINKATATPEEWQTLQKAILAKKQQIKSWFRYQHKRATRGASASHSTQSSLGNALFNAKGTRRRVHRATEIFQKRNRDLVVEELAKRGHDELNEEHMAVDGEDLEAQEERTKAARRERMRMRNEVVKELFEEAPLSERKAIAEAIRAEKESLEQGAEQSAPSLSSQQRQIAIDESGDVMETVLKTLAEKSGWFSFAIWGGPNPRHDGELSLKCAVYGNTPAGNDFIAQHANYDEGISLPFQEFLRRCFANGVLRTPIAPPADIETPDGLSAMPPGSETPLPPVEPPKKSGNKAKGKAPPKRIRKPKKAAPSAAPAAPTVTPTPAATPTPPVRNSGDTVRLGLGDNGDMLDVPGTDLDLEADLGPMEDVFNSPVVTEPLPSSSPSTLRPSHPSSWAHFNHWPEGMPAPTSPTAAARVAAMERGGTQSTATYVASVIDPALMQATPPPRPRPCFTGAQFAPNRSVGDSPTPPRPSSFRWGGPTAPHLRPGNQASGSKSTLPGLFDVYRELVATSPMRAYREQEAYRQELAARPRPDIFALPQAPRPPAPPGPISSEAARSPPAFTVPSPMASTLSTPPAPAAPQVPTPVVYSSRPMANPTRAAARAAKAVKAAVTGNSPAAAVAAAAKKNSKKQKKDVLTDITNSTPPSAVPAVPAAAPTPVGENVQLCVMRPGGNAAVRARAREAEKRIQAMEAERGRQASRMHNPDGNHDLVCVAPLRRSGRDSRVPPRPDEGYVRSTRGELRGKQGAPGLELVKRGGRGSTATTATKKPVAKAAAAAAKTKQKGAAAAKERANTRSS